MTGKVKIPIKRKGDLKKYGYAVKKSDKERKIAVALAVREYGHLTVMRKLLALSVLQKKRYPEYSKKFHKNSRFAMSLKPKR